MPGCVLRVSGEYFDVDIFLASCTRWKPTTVFRKGELRRPTKKGVIYSFSGFNLTVSKNEDFTIQINDASNFIDLYFSELKKLGNIEGQKVDACLSFSKFFEENIFSYALFPNTFVQEAAKLDLGLEIGMFEK